MRIALIYKYFTNLNMKLIILLTLFQIICFESSCKDNLTEPPPSEKGKTSFYIKNNSGLTLHAWVNRRQHLIELCHNYPVHVYSCYNPIECTQASSKQIKSLLIFSPEDTILVFSLNPVNSARWKFKETAQCEYYAELEISVDDLSSIIDSAFVSFPPESYTVKNRCLDI